MIKDKFNSICCDNCGEPLDSFDPLLNHTYCDKCTIRSEQISEHARKEFALFGEMLKKIRETKNG